MEVRKQLEQFLTLATLGDSQHHVPLAHHAHVAVRRVRRVQEEGPGPSAHQRRRYLARHEPGLPHTANDDAAG